MIYYSDLLVNPPYTPDEVAQAVANVEWQITRECLKGLSTERKLNDLRDYLNVDRSDRMRQVRVGNYIYALKRGGLLK